MDTQVNLAHQAQPRAVPKQSTGRGQLLKAVLLRSLFVLLVLYAILLASVSYAMHQPPERFGHFMSKMPVAIFLVAPFETMWTRIRAGNLTPGDSAPDFVLRSLDNQSEVSLTSFRNNKPVVLIFGSYT